MTTMPTDDTNANASILSVLHEERVFPPPPGFAQRARINSMAEYEALYRKSIESPDEFWGEQAGLELVWMKPWQQVLQWRPPFA